MQQYSPDHVTIIGNTSKDVVNVLVAQPTFGAGIAQKT